jgi:hypothetical protein
MTMFGTLNLDYKRNKPAKHVAYLFALRERNRRKIGSSFAFREAASSPRYEKREAIPPPTPARFAPRPPPTSSPPYRAGPGAARLPPPAPSPPHRALVSSPPRRVVAPLAGLLPSAPHRVPAADLPQPPLRSASRELPSPPSPQRHEPVASLLPAAPGAGLRPPRHRTRSGSGRRRPPLQFVRSSRRSSQGNRPALRVSSLPWTLWIRALLSFYLMYLK